MADILKIEKRNNTVPAVTTASTMYLVKVGSIIEIWVTDKTNAGALKVSTIGSDLLSTVNTYLKSQTVVPYALTSSGLIMSDANLSNNFKLLMNSDGFLMNPANLRDGMILNFRIRQAPSGNFKLAFDTKFKFPAGVTPTLSLDGNMVDFLSCYYDATDDTLTCNLTKGHPATTLVEQIYLDATKKFSALLLAGNNLVAIYQTNYITAQQVQATAGKSTGKYAFEMLVSVVGDRVALGLAVATAPENLTGDLGSYLNSIGYRSDGAVYSYLGGYTPGYATYTTNDIITACVDFDAKKIWFLKNGVSIQGNPGAGTDGFSYDAVALMYPTFQVNTNAGVTSRFKASHITTALPSGFLPYSPQLSV